MQLKNITKNCQLEHFRMMGNCLKARKLWIQMQNSLMFYISVPNLCIRIICCMMSKARKKTKEGSKACTLRSSWINSSALSLLDFLLISMKINCRKPLNYLINEKSTGIRVNLEARYIYTVLPTNVAHYNSPTINEWWVSCDEIKTKRPHQLVRDFSKFSH